MFWSKKNETGAKASAGARQPAAGMAENHPIIRLDFNRVVEVEAAHAGCSAGINGPDGYVIARGQGIRSLAVLPTRPGDKLQVETIVYADTDPPNGEPLVFFTGLLIYDASDQVVHWWTAKRPLTRAEGVCTVLDEIVAPAGAVASRIGICGPWKPRNIVSQGGLVSDGRIGVKAATVRKT